MSKVFLNDRIVDSDLATIPANDAGFLYGAGLFETMRCHNGVVFSLKDHLDRLCFSAAKLAIRMTQDRETLSDAIHQVLQSNGLTEARIRVTLSTGPMSQEDDAHPSTLLVSATSFDPYPEDYYRSGVQTILCPIRQNATDPLVGHKTTSCFARMSALKQAHRKNAAEAIWFTTEGHLAEGCVSNCFLVKDGKLMTPPIETPILPGVTRKNVCNIAIRDGLDLVETDLTIDDLLGADEVFLTNIIMKVLPVIGIEKHTVGTGKVGPVTEQIKIAFSEEIQSQCRSSV